MKPVSYLKWKLMHFSTAAQALAFGVAEEKPLASVVAVWTGTVTGGKGGAGGIYQSESRFHISFPFMP